MVNRKEGQRDKGRGSGFSYKKRDPKKMKERAEQTGGMFDSIFKQGVTSWRPQQGDNTIRILPPTFKDAEHYGLDIWVHQRVGPDKSTYLCPKKMKGDNCPICDAAAEAKADGEEEDGKKLTAKKQTVVYILDREGDDPELPVAYCMSWTMDRDIAALCNDKKTGEVLEIDNPDNGFDVMFKRTGKELNTRYVGIRIDRDESPILDKQRDQDEVLDAIDAKPLDEVLKFYDEAYLAKVVDGTVEKGDDDDDEKGGRSRRGRDDDDRGSSRRRSRDDDDDKDADKGEGRSRRRGSDDDDDKDADKGEGTSRRRSRDADDDDKPERTSRRSRDDDEDKSERTSRRSRDDDDKDKGDDDDRGSRRRGRDADDDDERGTSRRREKDPADDDAEDADKDSRSSRRRSRDDDDDKGKDDDAPRRRSGSRDEDAEEQPRRRRGDDDDKDKGDDDDRGSRRRRGSDDDDDADKGGRVRRK